MAFTQVESPDEFSDASLYSGRPLTCMGLFVVQHQKGRQPDGATSLSIIKAGEQISARIGDALLGFFLDRCCRLCWELKYRSLLTVAKHRQQDDAPVRKFKRIMVRPRLFLVDLTKDGHCRTDGQFS